MDKSSASRRDKYALLGALILLTLLFWTMIEGGLALGFSVIWLAAVGASYWYLRSSTVRVRSVASWLCLGGAILFTPAHVFGGTTALSVIVFIVQLCCWLIWMALVTGHGRVHRRLTDILPAMSAVLISAFSGLFELGEGLADYASLRRAEKAERAKDSSSEAAKRPFPWGIVGGIALAIPVLAILFPLLTSADAAFDVMIGNIVNNASDLIADFFDGLGTLVIALIIALILFYPVTGLMYSLRKTPSKEGERISNGFLSGSLLVGFFGSISLLCLAYLIAQLSYLFNGFLGILPNGMTPAEYARRGFFEIVTFSVIALGLVGIGLLFAKKDRFVRLINGMLIFLCAFTLLLISTAAAKMILYMQLYGLTVKRLTVSAILVILAILFISLILGRVFKKFPSLPIVVASVVLVFGALCIADPCRLVAEYNVAAWQSGALDQVDVYYLDDLGDNAIPALLKVYESCDANASALAAERLNALYEEKCLDSDLEIGAELPMTDGLLGFNYAEYTANRALNDFIQNLSQNY